MVNALVPPPSFSPPEGNTRGKAGERATVKREEQGARDGIPWLACLWLGGGDSAMGHPIRAPPQKPEALRGRTPSAPCSWHYQLLPRASRGEEPHCLSSPPTGFLVAGGSRGSGHSPAPMPGLVAPAQQS